MNYYQKDPKASGMFEYDPVSGAADATRHSQEKSAKITEIASRVRRRQRADRGQAVTEQGVSAATQALSSGALPPNQNLSTFGKSQVPSRQQLRYLSETDDEQVTPHGLLMTFQNNIDGLKQSKVNIFQTQDSKSSVQVRNGEDGTNPEILDTYPSVEMETFEMTPILETQEAEVLDLVGNQGLPACDISPSPKFSSANNSQPALFGTVEQSVESNNNQNLALSNPQLSFQENCQVLTIKQSREERFPNFSFHDSDQVQQVESNCTESNKNNGVEMSQSQSQSAAQEGEDRLFRDSISNNQKANQEKSGGRIRSLNRFQEPGSDLHQTPSDQTTDLITYHFAQPESSYKNPYMCSDRKKNQGNKVESQRIAGFKAFEESLRTSEVKDNKQEKHDRSAEKNGPGAPNNTTNTYLVPHHQFGNLSESSSSRSNRNHFGKDRVGQMLQDVKQFYSQNNKNTYPHETETLEPPEDSPGEKHQGGTHSPSKSVVHRDGFLMTLGKDCQPNSDQKDLINPSNRLEQQAQLAGGAATTDSFALHDPYPSVDRSSKREDWDGGVERQERDCDQLISIQGFDNSLNQGANIIELDQSSTRNLNLDNYMTSNFGTIDNEKSVNSVQKKDSPVKSEKVAQESPVRFEQLAIDSQDSSDYKTKKTEKSLSKGDNSRGPQYPQQAVDLFEQMQFRMDEIAIEVLQQRRDYQSKAKTQPYSARARGGQGTGIKSPRGQMSNKMESPSGGAQMVSPKDFRRVTNQSEQSSRPSSRRNHVSGIPTITGKKSPTAVTVAIDLSKSKRDNLNSSKNSVAGNEKARVNSSNRQGRLHLQRFQSQDNSGAASHRSNNSDSNNSRTRTKYNHITSSPYIKKAFKQNKTSNEAAQDGEMQENENQQQQKLQHRLNSVKNLQNQSKGAYTVDTKATSPSNPTTQQETSPLSKTATKLLGNKGIARKVGATNIQKPDQVQTFKTALGSATRQKKHYKSPELPSTQPRGKQSQGEQQEKIHAYNNIKSQIDDIAKDLLNQRNNSPGYKKDLSQGEAVTEEQEMTIMKQNMAAKSQNISDNEGSPRDFTRTVVKDRYPSSKQILYNHIYGQKGQPQKVGGPAYQQADASKLNQKNQNDEGQKSFVSDNSGGQGDSRTRKINGLLTNFQKKTQRVKGTGRSPYTRLYHEGTKRAQELMEQRNMEKQIQEDREYEKCTFTPNIGSNTRENQAQAERAWAADPNDHSAKSNSRSRKMTPQKSQKFFEKNIQWQNQVQQSNKKLKNEIEEEQQKMLTFKPSINTNVGMEALGENANQNLNIDEFQDSEPSYSRNQGINDQIMPQSSSTSTKNPYIQQKAPQSRTQHLEMKAISKHFERIKKGYQVRHQKEGAQTFRENECKIVGGLSRSTSRTSVKSNNNFTSRTNYNPSIGQNNFQRAQMNTTREEQLHNSNQQESESTAVLRKDFVKPLGKLQIANQHTSPVADRSIISPHKNSHNQSKGGPTTSTTRPFLDGSRKNSYTHASSNSNLVVVAAGGAASNREARAQGKRVHYVQGNNRNLALKLNPESKFVASYQQNAQVLRSARSKNNQNQVPEFGTPVSQKNGAKSYRSPRIDKQLGARDGNQTCPISNFPSDLPAKPQENQSYAKYNDQNIKQIHRKYQQHFGHSNSSGSPDFGVNRTIYRNYQVQKK